MKKSILLAALLAVAVTAAPAFASVQNIKVSGSIDSTFINRVNFDLGRNSAAGSEDQTDFITQATIDIEADLTDQASAKIGLINEKPWGEDSNATESVDIYNAYLTIREMLYSPLTVTIGRQNWAYGNGLIFDSAGQNNDAPTASGLDSVAADLTKQTALDAIRATFDYSPLIVDMFYAKVANDSSSGAQSVGYDDTDLYGVNGTYNLGDDMNTQVEAYFFGKVNKKTKADAPAGTKADTIYVAGARTSMDILDGLNTQLEYAQQFGTNELAGSANQSQNRNARIFQGIANYKIPNFAGGMDELNPMLQYVFTWASGNSNPSNTDTNADEKAWDPFFENQGGGSIFSAIFPLSNVVVHQVSLSATPLEDVTTTATWTGIWLDKEVNGVTGALISPNGGTTAVTYNDDKTDLGNEFGLLTTYDYTEDVQFGLNTSWFLPGDALAAANDNSAYQVLLNANVNF